MANHASTRTTELYDRRRDEVSLDEVERIVIGVRLLSQVARPAKSGCTFEPMLCNKKGQGIQGCFSVPEVLISASSEFGGLPPDSYPATNLQKRTLIRSPSVLPQKFAYELLG